MSKNKVREDPPIPKFIHLKIRREDGVESLTTIEAGKVLIGRLRNPVRHAFSYGIRHVFIVIQ